MLCSTYEDRVGPTAWGRAGYVSAIHYHDCEAVKFKSDRRFNRGLPKNDNTQAPQMFLVHDWVLIRAIHAREDRVHRSLAIAFSRNWCVILI